MRLIDANAMVTALLYDEEHEQTNEVKMTIGDFIDGHTKEGCLQSSGWISVKDRPPKIGETVLFTGKSSYGTRFITQRGWYNGTFWIRDTGEKVYSATPVTHWMPLPEPPRDEEVKQE